MSRRDPDILTVCSFVISDNRHRVTPRVCHLATHPAAAEFKAVMFHAQYPHALQGVRVLLSVAVEEAHFSETHSSPRLAHMQRHGDSVLQKASGNEMQADAIGGNPFLP